MAPSRRRTRSATSILGWATARRRARPLLLGMRCADGAGGAQQGSLRVKKACGGVDLEPIRARR